MKEFSVEVELIAEMAVHNPFDFFLEDSASHFPFAYDPSLEKDLAPFLEPSLLTPKFGAYFAAVKHDILGTPNPVQRANPPQDDHSPRDPISLTPGFSPVHPPQNDSTALAVSDPTLSAVATAAAPRPE